MVVTLVLVVVAVNHGVGLCRGETGFASRWGESCSNEEEAEAAEDESRLAELAGEGGEAKGECAANRISDVGLPTEELLIGEQGAICNCNVGNTVPRPDAFEGESEPGNGGNFSDEMTSAVSMAGSGICCSGKVSFAALKGRFRAGVRVNGF
jgi:hypothetical protein